jgi:hypothetical protein
MYGRRKLLITKLGKLGNKPKKPKNLKIFEKVFYIYIFFVNSVQ